MVALHKFMLFECLGAVQRGKESAGNQGVMLLELGVAVRLSLRADFCNRHPWNALLVGLARRKVQRHEYPVAAAPDFYFVLVCGLLVAEKDGARRCEQPIPAVNQNTIIITTVTAVSCR